MVSQPSLTPLASRQSGSRIATPPGGGSSGTGRTRAGRAAGSRGPVPCRGLAPALPDRRRHRRRRAGGGAAISVITALPAPVRGGSRTTRSTRSRQAPAGAVDPSELEPDVHGRIGQVPPSGLDRAGRRLDRPTRGNRRRPARRRTGRHRSRGRTRAPPASARNPSRTAPTNASAAAGCTCQNPSAPTSQSRPAARSCTTREPIRDSPPTSSAGPSAAPTAISSVSGGQDVPTTSGVDAVRDQTTLVRQRDQLVRPMGPQRCPTGLVDLIAHPAPPTEAIRGAGRRRHRLDLAGPVDPGQPPQLLGQHRRLEPALGADLDVLEVAAAAPPGPAIRHGTATRSGLGRSTSTASARQNLS